MSKLKSFLYAAAAALPLTCVLADEGVSPEEISSLEIMPIELKPFEPRNEISLASPNIDLTAVPEQTAAAAPIRKFKTAEKPFSPFTGKIKAKKVRLRVNADLDSQIIKELNKDEMLSIIGEKGDFWAVEAPSELKAYVFRSFVLENTIEGNRVNVRLEPDLDAPIIAHLSSGDKVQGIISPTNSKWLEINPPASTRFYVAKEFVSNIGGLEVKQQHEKRKKNAQHMLESASHMSKIEMHKAFDEIDIERVTHKYNVIINEYHDFPEYVEQAKESLASLQESYVQKKIAFLESKNSLAEEMIVMPHESLTKNIKEKEAKQPEATDKMKLWEPIEESLYLTWTRMNEDRTLQEFYDEQKINAVAVSGILEAYASPVKNKPGDFILKDKDLPVAYLYSTQINLQDMIGKKVTVVGTPRPNNNFAFPAYFVLSVE